MSDHDRRIDAIAERASRAVLHELNVPNAERDRVISNLPHVLADLRESVAQGIRLVDWAAGSDGIYLELAEGIVQPTRYVKELDAAVTARIIERSLAADEWAWADPTSEPTRRPAPRRSTGHDMDRLPSRESDSYLEDMVTKSDGGGPDRLSRPQRHLLSLLKREPKLTTLELAERLSEDDPDSRPLHPHEAIDLILDLAKQPWFSPADTALLDPQSLLSRCTTHRERQRIAEALAGNELTPLEGAVVLACSVEPHPRSLAETARRVRENNINLWLEAVDDVAVDNAVRSVRLKLVEKMRDEVLVRFDSLEFERHEPASAIQARVATNVASRRGSRATGAGEPTKRRNLQALRNLGVGSVSARLGDIALPDDHRWKEDPSYRFAIFLDAMRDGVAIERELGYRSESSDGNVAFAAAARAYAGYLPELETHAREAEPGWDNARPRKAEDASAARRRLLSDIRKRSRSIAAFFPPSPTGRSSRIDSMRP
jgi:hypothetical protein